MAAIATGIARSEDRLFGKSIVQLMSLQALCISEGYSAVLANGRAGTRSKMAKLKHLSLGPITQITAVSDSSHRSASSRYPIIDTSKITESQLSGFLTKMRLTHLKC